MGYRAGTEKMGTPVDADSFALAEIGRWALQRCKSKGRELFLGFSCA